MIRAHSHPPHPSTEGGRRSSASCTPGNQTKQQELYQPIHEMQRGGRSGAACTRLLWRLPGHLAARRPRRPLRTAPAARLPPVRPNATAPSARTPEHRLCNAVQFTGLKDAAWLVVGADLPVAAPAEPVRVVRAGAGAGARARCGAALFINSGRL